MTDVLKALGLEPHGSNHKTIKRIITEQNLSTAHFDVKKAFTRGKKYGPKMRSSSSIRPFPAPSLCRLVRKFTMMPYTCAVCFNEGTRQGRDLVLTVDHIDGVGGTTTCPQTCVTYVPTATHKRIRLVGGTTKVDTQLFIL